MPNLFIDPISKEYLSGLPLLAFDGDIHVIDTEEDCKKALKELRKTDIIGFDTETKPAFIKGQYYPTALVQLSTMDQAFLFRLNIIGYPHALFELMGDKNILKLGISIADDLKDLKKIKKFTPESFVDLNSIAQSIGVTHIGVKKLAAIFLDARISKNQQVSNWEAENLSAAQQRYAATDAWVCLAIHEAMKSKGYI